MNWSREFIVNFNTVRLSSFDVLIVTCVLLLLFKSGCCS